MIKQELFNKIIAHLKAQNKRSTRKLTIQMTKERTREEIEPAYISNDGNKCPAGCIFEDNEYNISMEGIAFDSILNLKETSQTLKDRCKDHLPLILELMVMHDFSEPETWNEQMKAIALKHNLELN
jgi:hypothetical protein